MVQLNELRPSAEQEIANILALLRSGRGQDAENVARSLQRRYPSRADANEALALVLVNVGKMGDAFKFAEAAVRLDPTNTNYIINMGRLYLEAELIEEASPLLEKAYAMNPKLFQAPLALGEFYSATGNGRRAVAYLRQALAACPPQMRHMIEMKLAEDLSALGQNDEAQAIYQGLQGHPTLRQRALSRAVNLKKFGIESEYFRQLNHEIAKGPQSTDTEVDLRLALGHVFENSGRYDEAFEQYRLSKAEAVGQYPIEEFKGVVSDLIEMFQAQEMESFANFGDPSELPVFVVGLPRSGTTMTEQIIAAHPEGGGVGESRRIGGLARAMIGRNQRGLFARMREGGPVRCRELATGYVKMLKFMAPGALRVVDKMPHNFMNIGFISLFFPGARIVHCLRNPADNFISAFQRRMNVNHSYSYAPEDYALYYKEYRRLMAHWHQLLPGRIFDLRYEDTTGNPRETVARLLEFLGLPWDEACLNFHERGAMVKTFSRQQVRNPINRASVERWRNYESHIKPLLDILREDARADGYEL
jgi:tetratricopeptide (TPR) repeat protein